MQLSRAGAAIASLSLALALGPTACSVSEPPETPGFEIVLVETGEVVFSDIHIEDYDFARHRLVLSYLGRQRCQDFGEWGTFGGRRFPRLGRLAGCEFVLRIDGQDIYTGHFWSMAMSLLRPGLKIYDTVDFQSGDLFIRIDQLGESPIEDPRLHPMILDHFRKRKLRE